MDKFKGRLPKDDLKRFAKEVCLCYFFVLVYVDHSIDSEEARQLRLQEQARRGSNTHLVQAREASKEIRQGLFRESSGETA